MEEFYVKACLFSPKSPPPIVIAMDSQLQITVELMDYTIPQGATAAAFSNGSYSDKIYTQACTVSGNKITFTPQYGFFVLGKNQLQFKISNGVITLPLDVDCRVSLPESGESAEPDTVKPLVEQALSAAREALESNNAAAGSASSAAGSADAAGKSAADALQSKNAAASSASSAAGSATAAGQSANAAAGSASAALGSQNAAAGSAQEAKVSKNAAANSAEAAAGSASSAAGSASAAAGSAQEALESKNAAAGSAQAAREAMEKTQEISVNPAYIGDNGNWFVWDITQDSYVDTGVKAQGPQGVPGTGNVSSVCGVKPGNDGNVALTAENVGARPDSWVPTAADAGALPSTGGTMTGPINMNGQSISGLNDPAEDTQAARKGYVDASIRKAAPRNLLDNSDFTNLVAQAGIGGNHGTVAYAADRWILTSGTVSYTAGTGMTLNGTITQKLENAPAAAYPYVGMVSGTASISYADGAVTITSSGGVIKWVALYEGAYTAETLPEYQPKGYRAELAECQRYCLVIDYSTNNYISGYVTVSTTTRVNAYFPLPVPMRTTPSLSSTDGSAWVVTIDGTAFVPTEAVIWFMSVNAILGMRFHFSTELGLRKTGVANYNSGTKLILSADL